MNIADLIWTIVGLLLTLLVFSYLFGDNILFRIAANIFVGVSAGYVLTLVIYQVLLPRLVDPLINGAILQVAVPLVLGILLLFKLVPRFSNLGNVSMAYLVGAGAAIIITGAVTGTLLGQSWAIVNLFDLRAAAANRVSPFIQLGGGVFILLGTISTLAYFHFGGSAKPNQAPARKPWISTLARIGQFFIAVTLGALFAGIFASSLTALIERIDFLKNFFISLI